MINGSLGHIDTIIWDWNGTLLDDTGVCLDAINALLADRNLPVLSLSEYRDIFTFPVKEYYSLAGFDFNAEPFDEVAVEFMDLYRKGFRKAGLHKAAREVLNSFKSANYRQIMVSAMEHGLLVRTVTEKGLIDCFDLISGIHNHFAESKLEMALSFIKTAGINPLATCLIGDTLHDHEVAIGLGTSCVLIANGHQSYKRLNKTGSPVVRSIEEVLKIFDLKNESIKTKR